MRSRDTIGATPLYICAAGALLSAVAATADVTDADPAAQGVEVWRLVGYVFFAVVFVLLARAPRQLRGLWEVTIAAKAALPVAALTIASDADEATTLLIFDGALVVVLAVAYVVMSGWTADRPNRSTAAGPVEVARMRDGSVAIAGRQDDRRRAHPLHTHGGLGTNVELTPYVRGSVYSPKGYDATGAGHGRLLRPRRRRCPRLPYGAVRVEGARRRRVVLEHT